ncbi:AAA family ATPase [Magnaporthiopsis poae ATCC 64411]|uniref:AAA family ATPase n=1 Tax=Magnaporthiopsis poae (strain ATCC 64411 / 73-15) TaxID=644358 RepID=A0A0C4DNW3_MAGP6|nr:AAA family ATPase [Magnaporthiopsis poae ATCC 64411]
MDSQEPLPVEARKGAIPKSANADDAKSPAQETSSGAKTPDTDSKVPSGRKEQHKNVTKAKRAKKPARPSPKKGKKQPAPASDSSDLSDSGDDLSSSSSSESDDSESEPEVDKKKRSAKKRHEPAASKKKRGKKDIVVDPEAKYASDSGASDVEAGDANERLLMQQQQHEITRLRRQVQQLQLHPATLPVFDPIRPSRFLPPAGRQPLGSPLSIDPRLPPSTQRQGQMAQQSSKRKASRLEYKRVDQVWDNNIHAYKLQDTAETSTDAQYDEYLFHVRRSFDWEGKFKHTFIDIKSKLLRECLQDVMGNIKGVSLVEDTPKLDPNMLFLYLEDLTKHVKALKKMKAIGSDKHSRKKAQKRIDDKREHLKVLIKYINKDYETVKSSLYPMLENGLITFDLFWALWKPGTLAYMTTYGSHDEPRVFKIEMAEKNSTIMKGNYYFIDGKYFEYDGKQFGFGGQMAEVAEFRGARKITSLPVYPLAYHKNEEQVRKDLIERGKKFVSLAGVHYRAHQGMAYYKKKRSIVKVNINGRIMVDPSTHRRINPNYPVSHVRPKDHDVLTDDEGEDDGGDANDSDGGGGCVGSGSDAEGNDASGENGEKIKFVNKVVTDPKGNIRIISIPKNSDDQNEEKLAQLDDDKAAKEDGADATGQDADDEKARGKAEKAAPEFSDEEYLIASPVVLGFSFAEKFWLEFTVSGIKDIQWNESAYESLVLEPKTKDIVKALVESHKYHAAESIDDVIVGKGKGLVAVLHGPPGTGKTLTAEGISELLKCPLYMVSVGELGTDSRFLEAELQKILDICHAWGAILLLDEADVFLEKRTMNDVHRNALVSIFLRQLEYFQGILFLTTNRVQTFDDAFQSRIHIALRYDSLTAQAKKAIFKIFVERVRVLEKVDLMPFTEDDYTSLARHDLNGRQIKNTVRTAQALAVNKGEPLAMKHIRQVLDVHMSFDKDLKGGTGFDDAMRSYC